MQSLIWRVLISRLGSFFRLSRASSTNSPTLRGSIIKQQLLQSANATTINNFMFKREARFSSSKNFNPPPNIYQPYTSFTKLPKKIRTGSLMGPSEPANSLGSFGGVRRFTLSNNQNPGPGSYAANEEQKSSSKAPLKPRKRAQSELHAMTSTIAPINNEQIFVGKPLQRKQEQIDEDDSQEIKPGYSFPKSRYKERQTLVQQCQQPQQTVEEGLSAEQYQSVIRIKQENRKRKLDLLQMILKKQIPKPNALTLQYQRKNQDKASPGPGTYETDIKTQRLVPTSTFQSKIQKIASGPKDTLAQFRGPGAYNIEQKGKPPGYYFTRSERATNLVDNKEMPFQFYNKELPAKKSFNKPSANYQAPFGSGCNRFPQMAKQAPQSIDEVLKKPKSRRSTRYQDSQASNQQEVKSLQNIEILSNFYRNM